MLSDTLCLFMERSLEGNLCMGRHLKEAKNTYDNKHKLHTFSVGIAGSPDLAAAQKVADFLGTVHHELTFTVQQGLDALSDLIYHIESYEQVVLLFLSFFSQERSLSCMPASSARCNPPFQLR